MVRKAVVAFFIFILLLCLAGLIWDYQMTKKENRELLMRLENCEFQMLQDMNCK